MSCFGGNMRRYLTSNDPPGATPLQPTQMDLSPTLEQGRISVPGAIKELTATWSRARRRVLKHGRTEDIHALRTGSRKLRVSIELARDPLGFDYEDPFAGWQTLQKRLSRLRDWDVARSVLEESRGRLLDSAVGPLDRRIRHIGRKRRRSMKRAVDALSSSSVRQVIRSIRMMTREGNEPPVDRNAAAEDWWKGSTVALEGDPIWRLRLHPDGLIPDSTLDAVHAVRRSVRSLRYGMEWWKMLGVPILPELLEFTRAVQANLGRLRDVTRVTELVEGDEIAPLDRWLARERAKVIARWNEIRFERWRLASTSVISL